MKILSLFDGMSCGMVAMKNIGINVERYVAYEIDKYAVQTSLHNFPEIEQKSDVFTADFTEYKGFDYLIGGSPCTYWSIAQTKNRETVASGMGWELFSQYVRALKEAEPKYFLYENNKSMSAAIRASITETFGFEPILINSALVSAQNRQRLYWCGIRQADGTYKKADIQQPTDRGILLKDILEKIAEPVQPITEKEMDYMIRDYQDRRWDFCNKPGQENKSKCLVANFNKGIPYNILAEPVICRQVGRNLENPKSRVSGLPTIQMFETRLDQKSGTLTTVTKDNLVCEPLKICEITNAPIYEVKDGFITVKDNKYPIKLEDGFYIIRKLTVRECMRLQTVPEWYEWPVSKSQAYKMLGNGWTVEVIMHLIQSTLTRKKKNDDFVLSWD